MADANVRRRGAVNPEPGKGHAQLETGPVPERTSGDGAWVTPKPRLAATPARPRTTEIFCEGLAGLLQRSAVVVVISSAACFFARAA